MFSSLLFIFLFIPICTLLDFGVEFEPASPKNEEDPFSSVSLTIFLSTSVKSLELSESALVLRFDNWLIVAPSSNLDFYLFILLFMDKLFNPGDSYFCLSTCFWISFITELLFPEVIVLPWAMTPLAPPTIIVEGPDEITELLAINCDTFWEN